MNDMYTASQMYTYPGTYPGTFPYFAGAQAYAPVPGMNDGVGSFVSLLEQRGFIVQEGKLSHIDILKLTSLGIIDNAFANNAGAPYATYLLPPAPNQDPSPGQKPPKGYRPNDPNNYPANINYVAPGFNYKLRPDEAIVMIGRTPPPAYNFSFRSYLGFVHNKPGKDYSNTVTAGNNQTGFYHNIGASMGDQINNTRIWTSGTPYGAPGNPFDSSTIIITTTDMGINRLMRDTLAQAGFSPGIMNNDNIPSGLTNIGLEKGKDTFNFIMRAAIWKDHDTGWDYINNLNQFVRVFRITPMTAYPAMNPWPVETLRVRETTTTEFQIVPNARAELGYLRNMIIRKYGRMGFRHTDVDSSLWILDGYEGIVQDVPVVYDNRDGTYFRSDDFQFKTDDDFVIIYGVNHVQAGKATFFNTSFYGEALWNGVAGANITDVTPYSAGEYFPMGYPNANAYFAVKMARKAVEGNEVIIPYSTGNPNGFAFGVDNNQDAYIGFRVYTNPETGVGPALFDIVWGHVMVFTKQ